MELELYLSRQARRKRFALGQPELEEPVRLRVDALPLAPHTRELLFDTFGNGRVRVPPEILRVDRVPESDVDFWLVAQAYRTARTRRRWRRYITRGAWIGLAVLFIAVLSSPLLGIAELALITVLLYTILFIYGLIGS